jgi:hypothetical protein
MTTIAWNINTKTAKATSLIKTVLDAGRFAKYARKVTMLTTEANARDYQKIVPWPTRMEPVPNVWKDTIWT